MSYSQTTWQVGSLISSSALNNIENVPVDTSPYIVSCTETSSASSTIFTLDKSFNDLYEASAFGRAVILKETYTLLDESDQEYGIIIFNRLTGFDYDTGTHEYYSVQFDLGSQSDFPSAFSASTSTAFLSYVESGGGGAPK